MVNVDDMDELRLKVLARALEEAAFDGWTAQILERAAALVMQTGGLNEAVKAQASDGPGTDGPGSGGPGGDASFLDAGLLFPGGAGDILALWSTRCDAQMRAAYEALAAPPEKIREKITWLVRTRIELLEGHREAARRASATLALPGYVNDARKMTWATVDAMWRSIGDRTTDFNYYTKRGTLSLVYLSTLMKWYADGVDSDATEPYAATWAFLDDRIDNVMQFEKLKAKAQKMRNGPRGLLESLAALRHGPRRR